VLAVEIKDRGQRVEIAGARFRHLIGIKLGWNLVLSNNYQVLPRGQEIVFSGHGFGHNLGLCLAGAKQQARQGLSFREILNYYFPAAQLAALDHGKGN
jgi:stage II sporulation protein D